MSYKIEERKVAGVVKEASHAIEGKGFNHGEVLVGLAELLGRIIVDAGSTSLAMDDMERVVHEHLRRTIRIGAFHAGKAMIEKG